MEQEQTTAGGVETPPERATPHVLFRIFGGIVRTLLPLVVIGAGAFGAWYFVKTKPKASQRPPQRMASLVEVRDIYPSTEQVQIEAMGTVLAAREVELKPRVQGEVIHISDALIPGGHVRRGDVLVRIDPRDYELAVEQARSMVAEAEYALTLEQGHQDIAKREWELLGADEDASDLDRELALRQPHLKKAKAALRAAEAMLARAELDLARTVITAPFNGVITGKNIEPGAQASSQTQLATLVGTDEYWVQVSIPVDQLAWVDVPFDEGGLGSGVIVRQYLGGDTWARWQGHVIRLLSDLDPAGRMARLLVRVPDPLGLTMSERDSPPLLIGAYVDVEVAGKVLAGTFAIDRSEVRDQSSLWFIDADDQLEIRPIQPVFRERSRVFVTSGLAPGERLITSDLPAPVAGMPLRLASDQGTQQDAVARSRDGGHQ